jgi:hypothetical protein
MRIPIITTIGALDVEIHFMPADPDAGYNTPYVDEMYLYYCGTNDLITADDSATLAQGEELRAIEKEYIRELQMQAAIAQAYNRGFIDG